MVRAARRAAALAAQVSNRETVLAQLRESVDGIFGNDLIERTGLGPARLYPLLDELEREGVIVGEFDSRPLPRRRRYRIAS